MSKVREALKELIEDVQGGKLTPWSEKLLIEAEQKLRELLPDVEVLAEKVHKAYCHWYLKKHKKPYWSYGNYNLLDEETKEADRYTVRAVLDAVNKAMFNE